MTSGVAPPGSQPERSSFEPRSLARSVGFRICAVALSVYLTCVVIEAGLELLRVQPRSPSLLMRGLFVADPELGHRLTPGFSLVWDDGIVHGARQTINALGQRDRDPVDRGVPRVLLIGDSHAFGALLDDTQTIDRAIEQASGDRFDAYNLGVPGYGAASSRIGFERIDLPATHAVYLFYHNDLRNDAMDPTATTVHRGFLVSRFDSAGRPYDASELDRRTDAILHPRPRIAALLRLERIRSAWPNPRTRQEPLPGSGPPQDLVVEEGDHPLGYRAGNVDRVAGEVGKMRAVADARGMRFAVLILSGMAEAAQDVHFSLVQRLIERLRQSGIEIIDPIGPLDRSTYHAHDLHLNARGAQITAQAILDWLERSPG